MTRASTPHKPYSASERKATRSKRSEPLKAAMALEEAKLRHASETVIDPRKIAGQVGAQKALIALALDRAAALDEAKRLSVAASADANLFAQRAAGASPTSKTGEKVRNVQVVMSGGKTKVVAVRDISTSDQCAFIDTLSVVFSASTLRKYAPVSYSREGGFDEHYDDLIIGFAETFQTLFGVAITRKLAKGRNFYRATYEIGEDLGHVGLGGNNDTVQIHLTGKGCLLARDGWEQRLFDWLTHVADEPRISRIDLAHDDFAGDVSVDHMFARYYRDEFTNGGRRPSVNLHGDWVLPDGKGRTLQVGSRENGLLYRGYEKGREQGDTESPWVRHEVQLGNKCRVIPLNALVFPGQYFAGAYAALYDFGDKQTRIETGRKTTEASFKHVVEVAKLQMGRAINLMMDTYKDPARVIAELIREGYPKAFKVFQADHWTPMERGEPFPEVVQLDQAFQGQHPGIRTATGFHDIPLHAVNRLNPSV